MCLAQYAQHRLLPEVHQNITICVEGENTGEMLQVEYDPETSWTFSTLSFAYLRFKFNDDTVNFKQSY